MNEDRPYWQELVLCVLVTATVVLILKIWTSPAPLPVPPFRPAPECRENYVSLRKGVCVPGYLVEQNR